MPFNSRSLENLKPENRTQNKQRRNFTLLPKTIEWLELQPNASAAIDRLVTEQGNKDSEMLSFYDLLYQSWKLMAREQVGSDFSGHPIGLKELHDRCFSYLEWQRFLDLLGSVKSESFELVPSRSKNYVVAGRQVGAMTFHVP
jgi:hypothetical protein